MSRPYREWVVRRYLLGTGNYIYVTYDKEEGENSADCHVQTNNLAVAQGEADLDTPANPRATLQRVPGQQLKIALNSQTSQHLAYFRKLRTRIRHSSRSYIGLYPESNGH